MIGISVDDVDASRTLARRERIGFALLSDDADLSVSRAYVGVDSNDLSIPGAVLIGRDGTIAYRRISSDKADRPSTGDLLAAIDRAFGPPARDPGLRGGYAPSERLQLGVAIGGGLAGLGGDDGDTDATAVTSLSALYPLRRHLLLGAAAGASTPGTHLDLDGALALRLPFLDDLAAWQLTTRAGFSTGALRGWHAGSRLGLSFAVTPSWALGLSAGATVYRLDGDDRPVEITLTLELSHLVRVR